MEEYYYDIKYRAGKQNVVADALSRIKVNVNENNLSANATIHSANTDDSEFIPMTLLPVNHFFNQIILRISSIETHTIELVYPRTQRRTISKTPFTEEQLIEIF